jgi:uncharacterized protein
MSSFAVEGVDSIAAVPRSEWERLASGAPLFAGYAWLEMIERDRRVPAHYLLARRQSSELVGALPLYVVESPRTIDAAYDFSRGLFTGRAERLDAFPAVLLGSRSGYTNGPLTRADLAQEERSEILEALFERAVEVARERGAHTVAAMYLPPSAYDVAAARLEGAVAWFAGAHARIDVPESWSTLGDYLASLKHSRRAQIKRDLTRFATSGYRVYERPLADVYGDVAPLVANLNARHGLDVRPDEMEVWLELRAAALGERAAVYLCESSDRLVACSIVYESADELYLGGVGFDLERRSLDGRAYFALAFYMPLERAIRARRRVFHLGPGASDAKVRRGARLEPLWTLVLPLRALSPEWAATATRRSCARLEMFRRTVGVHRDALASPSWSSEPVPRG